jgi:osmoprotectant transport system ATP-binding protein
MDEPFGAVDRVTRDRLQLEFLRILRETKKTVVFVTHDIDEAVRLGDRIAILSEGGHLEQYDPPAELLGRPKTPFVEAFLGDERAAKRLAVLPIEAATLAKDGAAPGSPEVAPDATMAEALDAMLLAGTDHVRVGDRGILTLTALFRASAQLPR